MLGGEYLLDGSLRLILPAALKTISIFSQPVLTAPRIDSSGCLIRIVACFCRDHLNNVAFVLAP